MKENSGLVFIACNAIQRCGVRGSRVVDKVSKQIKLVSNLERMVWTIFFILYILFGFYISSASGAQALEPTLHFSSMTTRRQGDVWLLLAVIAILVSLAVYMVKCKL